MRGNEFPSKSLKCVGQAWLRRGFWDVKFRFGLHIGVCEIDVKLKKNFTCSLWEFHITQNVISHPWISNFTSVKMRFHIHVFWISHPPLQNFTSTSGFHLTSKFNYTSQRIFHLLLCFFFTFSLSSSRWTCSLQRCLFCRLLQVIHDHSDFNEKQSSIITHWHNKDKPQR